MTVTSVNPLGAVFDQIGFVDASHIRLEQLKVKGSIRSSENNTSDIHVVGNDVTGVFVGAPRTDSPGPGPRDWVIEYNDIHDCPSLCVALTSHNPDSYWPISSMVVRGNKIGPMNGGADGIRIHNWRDIVIEDNEIFGVIDDGQHNDCLQSVWGGQGLVFARNYLHDNNCQTFFLKDGYTQDIVFEENLSVRNRADGGGLVGQIWNSRNVVIRNNTMWDDSSFYLRSGSYDSKFTNGPVEEYEVTNNVMVNFIPYDNAQPNSNRAGLFKDPNILTEDFNVFGGGWTWVPHNMGPHSIQDSNPNFINETTTRTQDLATGDWRLPGPVTNGGQTYTAGITWRLAGRNFGTQAYNNPNPPPATTTTTPPPATTTTTPTTPPAPGNEPGSASPVHSTGLVDPLSGKWYLYDGDGKLSTSFFFGTPGDYPFMGDWNGDGIETPGLYRQSDGLVYLRNSNTQGTADVRFLFGNPGDVPIAGDFNGDGFDTVSIYRPSNQTIYVINKLGANHGGLGAAEFRYVFGNPGDRPFVGDFDGDGVETVGLYRESAGMVYLGIAQRTAEARCVRDDWGARLIAGAWTGDGVFTPALFRTLNATMYFNWTSSSGGTHDQFVAGRAGWVPVAGRMN